MDALKSWKDRARRYKIDEQELLAMWLRQGLVCAICGQEPSIPHVDHDHVTGKVRGILCPRCNRLLGLAGDSGAILQSASTYLKRSGTTKRKRSERRRLVKTEHPEVEQPRVVAAKTE